MYTVVLVTASKYKEARDIAGALIKGKLAACVTIIKSIESVFWWEGKIDKAHEALLIIKTRKSCVAKVIKKVKSMHSYAVPEIIALPIIAGNKGYLEWIHASTK